MVKRTLTLLEIMIVIFLITIITGAISYNMKGALDKGKAFRTERAIEQLREIILLRRAEGKEMAEILRNVPDCIRASGLAKDPTALLKDGWGELLEITSRSRGEDVSIRSRKLDAYRARHEMKGSSTGVAIEEEDI